VKRRASPATLRARFGSHRPIRGSFFNPVWLWTAAATALLGIATSQTALTLLGIVILVTAGVAHFWTRLSLTGVVYSRALSADRALPGDEVLLTLSVVNTKPIPLPWLTVEEEISEGLIVRDRPTTPSGRAGYQLLRIATALGPYERVTWRVRLGCPTRGVQAVGPVTLASGDPFGFFTERRALEAATSVIVYPRVASLPALGFPAKHPVGDIRAARELLTDPTRIIGARDYQPGDPFRAIHWKATARQGHLQVRVQEPATALQLGLFVNLDSFSHYWEGLDLAVTERAIVIAASLASWAIARRNAVGVYANGVVAGSDQALRVPPGRDPAQLARILEGLAKVSPYATLNVAKTLRVGAARFPRGSTMIVITAQMSDPLVAALADLLNRGYQTMLIPLANCPLPPLRGLLVRHLELPGEISRASANLAHSA